MKKSTTLIGGRKKLFRIFTDGSCKNNGRDNTVGGWAYVILDENDNIVKEDYAAQYDTTNNRMEMTAIIESVLGLLSYLNEVECDKDPKIEIYTDSAYVHSCIKDKWYKSWIKNDWKNSTKQPVKNKDLWEVLIRFFEDEQFSFYKVKGHSTSQNKYSYWNNYVDELAQSAAQELKEN